MAAVRQTIHKSMFHKELCILPKSWWNQFFDDFKIIHSNLIFNTHTRVAASGVVSDVVVGVGVVAAIGASGVIVGVAVVAAVVAAIGVSGVIVVVSGVVESIVISVSDLELTLKSCVGIGSSWKYFAK